MEVKCASFSRQGKLCQNYSTVAIVDVAEYNVVVFVMLNGLRSLNCLQSCVGSYCGDDRGSWLFLVF